MNAISIGLETDYQATHIGQELPVGYRSVDAMFCLVFTLELLMKLSLLGCAQFFYGPNATWQVFDFLVVGFQLADYIVKSPLLGGSSKGHGGMNMTVFRLLRLLRLARILRIVRIFRAFQLID